MSAPATPPSTALRWLDPWEAPLRLSGFGWLATDRALRRLPLQPPRALPAAVDALAWCTAGGQVRFISDTDVLEVRVTLRTSFGMDCHPAASPYGFEHMPQTGVSGCDLYLGPPGQERFYAVTRFAAGTGAYTSQLLARNGRQPLSFILNLPLFNGVEALQIGLREGAMLAPPPLQHDRPVVFYGTSITHGGCASRPGACYTNILSRRLRLPVLNLGFSGSGQGEPEVAEAIATLEDPALFVLDYQANSGERMDLTLPGFVAALRSRHPTTPILVVSRIRYGKEALSSEPTTGRAGRQCRAYQRTYVDHRRAGGDAHIHYYDGTRLLGRAYDECTVDGVHPNDLGFFKMADGLAPVIATLLQ